MRPIPMLTIAASALGLAAIATPARAADPCAGGLATAQIVDCLKPHGLSGPSRGIRAPSGAPTASPPAHGAAMAQQPPLRPSVNLLVPFDFGSAQLTAAGRRALDALGKALQQPDLAGARFEIGGHTDAVGTPAYNLALSQHRADAARDYLVNHEHIDPSRLTTIGYGATRLYDTARPDAAVNRRVQVTRLGS